MAKPTRTRRRRAPARPAAAADVAAPAASEAAPPPPPPTPSTHPGCWRDVEVPWTTWVVFRLVFFGLHAVDAFLQISHAPRYGAGGFNVAHFAWVPGLDQQAYLLVQCTIAGLASMIAVGVSGRWLPAALAALYGWAYFGSQLDSYQHHYLVWLLLVLWCWVPGATRADDDAPPPPVRSAALRVILLQLSIMYLWAAISKLEPKWIDGAALSQQLHGALRGAIEATVGFKLASWMVIATELALAATLWRARTQPLALALGLGLHGAIAVSGLEIGAFAYVMFALYLLLIPERALRAVTAWWPRRWSAALHHGHRGVAFAAVAVTFVLLFRLRPPLLNPVVPMFFAIGATLTLRWNLQALRSFATRAALAALLLVATIVVVDRLGDVSVDYFRYWGGAARRLGDLSDAERAYRGLVEVAPRLEVGRYHLGRLLVGRGELEAGLAHLREAERLAPDRPRAALEQARALDAAGRHDEAEQARRRAHAPAGGGAAGNPEPGAEDDR